MKKTFFLFFAVNRENRMWSFTIIGLVTLSLTMQSFISAPQSDGDEKLSPSMNSGLLVLCGSK